MRFKRGAGAARTEPRLQKDVFIALAAIAWADGHVADEESAALLAAARSSGIDGADLEPIREALMNRTALDRLSKLSLSSDEREFVYAVAAWIARVDGVVEPEESAALARLAGFLTLSDEQTSRAALAIGALGIEETRDHARDFAQFGKAFSGAL